MRARKIQITVIASLAAIALLTGCGGTPYQSSTTTTTSTGSTSTTTSTGTSTTTSSDGSTTTTDTAPDISTSFSLNGPGGTTTSYSTTVNTDNTLNVEIIAGGAGQMSLSGYSNYEATYGCISYEVSALGTTQQTGTLAVSSNYDVSFNCYGAPTSTVLDFSSSLSPGHGDITVTVTPVGYDFYCQYCEDYPSLFGYACSGYCPLHSIYKSHTVTGTMVIQVDGTAAL
jgi:hypothetical protein